MFSKPTYGLVSFNCKSAKRSVDHIRDLCQSYDIIALQETWLLPDDIQFLGDIDQQFGFTGTSAVDTAAGMLRGRPYGGVALLWNKSVFQNVSVVQCDNPRVCAINITLGQRSFLVFSVYMPTDKVENLAEFTNCLSLVSAIINNNNTGSVYVLGDLNAHPGEKFFEELSCFSTEQEWVCADVEVLGLNSNAYTFISEANGSRRWLDHCVVTKAAAGSILDIYPKYDVIWSDHFPLIIECDFGVIKPQIVNSKSNIVNKVLWGERKLDEIDMYSKLCHEKLRLIDFPNIFVNCADSICKNFNHRHFIDKFYFNIVNVLSRASTESHNLNASRFKKKKHIGGFGIGMSGKHTERRGVNSRCGFFIINLKRVAYLTKCRKAVESLKLV